MSMDQKQRVGSQRAMAQEALGKLKAIGELFGLDNEAQFSQNLEEKGRQDWLAWDAKIKELESWIWDESPIA